MPDQTRSAPSEEPEGPLRSFRNIPVVIERPLGFVQRGVSRATGKPWIRVYGYDSEGEHIPDFIGYGCIPRTLSGDGEDLDVYLGAVETSDTAYLVEQGGNDPEHKLFLGWPSQEAAVACYGAHTPIEMLAGVTAVPIALIQALLGVADGPEGMVKKSSGSLVAAIKATLAAPVSREQARIEKAAASPSARFLTKAAEGELRYVLGIVLEPLDANAGEADTQGDAYTEDEIRKAMWLYMMYFQNVSLQHKVFLNGKVYLVECWQTKEDCVIEGSNIRKGTWLAGFHVPDDEVWGMILDGTKSGLSIGGVATKTPIEA